MTVDLRECEALIEMRGRRCSIDLGRASFVRLMRRARRFEVATQPRELRLVPAGLTDRSLERPCRDTFRVLGTPFESLSDQMVGPLMYGITADPVVGAKVLSEFARENELFVIRGGAMPGSRMSDKDVKALALLPSREQLLAKLVGTLQAPVAKLVRTMNEVPARFARTLAAYRDSKQKAAA